MADPVVNAPYYSETDALKNKLPRDDKCYENARIIPISENNELSSAKDKYVPNQIEIIWNNLKVDVQIKKKIV